MTRSRTSAGSHAPPLKSSASGRAVTPPPAASRWRARKSATWRVIAESAAYGRPSSAPPLPRAGRSSAPTRGKKPSSTASRTASRATRAVSAPPMTRPPRPGTVTASSAIDASASIASFTSRHWLTSRWKRCASSGAPPSCCLHAARERQVHVVAAEQEVVADRHALDGELAAAVPGGHEREVGGAATDVDDQNEWMARDRVAPVAFVYDQPGVEGRLRLLEQHEPVEARRARRLDRQLARHGVERRRHGEHDLLLGERFGKVRVPGVDHVPHDARRRVDGRDARDVVGRAPRQNGRGPVDAAVAEPRLRRGHEPARHPGALLARERRRRRSRVLEPTADRGRRPAARAPRPDRRTTAASSRGSTRPTPVSCGISKTSIARPRCVSTYAQAVLVVPRSIPTR